MPKSKSTRKPASKLSRRDSLAQTAMQGIYCACASPQFVARLLELIPQAPLEDIISRLAYSQAKSMILESRIDEKR